MVKILGLLDLAAAGLLLSNYYRIEVPAGLIIIISILLIIKGVIFFVDPTSFIDIATGILLIISFSTPLSAIIVLPFALFVGLKGIMSLPAS